MSLKGKVFIVTGGASGIGKATVKKLVKLSANVHVLDLSKPDDYQDALGQQVSYLIVDVASRDSVKAALDKIAAHETQVDGLVNCAAILRPTDRTPESDKTFRLLWDVNVMGTWNINMEFYHLVKTLRKHKSGAQNHPPVSIVNLGSMASVRGIAGMSGYVASKHAVLGLSRTWAQEWGPEGFRVNTLAPGAVNTPMIAGQPDGSENLAYKGAFKTMSEPEEIADTILYLLGDGSSSISGQLIEINGGWP